MDNPVYRRPKGLDHLVSVTHFSRQELKRLYRAFKAEAPTGLITEETFRTMYSQFFPKGGTLNDSSPSLCYFIILPHFLPLPNHHRDCLINNRLSVAVRMITRNRSLFSYRISLSIIDSSHVNYENELHFTKQKIASAGSIITSFSIYRPAFQIARNVDKST